MNNLLKYIKSYKQDIYIIVSIVIVLLISYIIYKMNSNEIKKSNRIAVCTWYDDGIKKYADIARDINQKYCDLHGYEFIVKHDRKLRERQQQWECIPTVLELVNTGNYDYIVWIDADAVFRLNHKNFNLLENIIDDNNNKNIILSADTVGYDIINTGIFIVKSNNYTKDILQQIIDSKDEKCMKYNEWGHEQECMTYFYKDNINNFKDNTVILEEGILQSWHKANNNIQKEYNNSLILHLAGVNNDDRYKIFKNLKEDYYLNYFIH